MRAGPASEPAAPGGYAARPMAATDVQSNPGGAVPAPPAKARILLGRAAWTLGIAVAAVLFVRTFVGDVYHVDSGSMEPTLWGAEGGGEWVFVRYTGAPPARQDLVVAQRPGDDAPIVKRVLGLPGESVQVSGGDVLVNGRRLAADAPRPPWVVVYDQGERALDERFPIAAAQRPLWNVRPGVAELDARGVPRDANANLGVLRFQAHFNDDYLGPQGELVRGASQASDARVECRVVVRDARSQVRFGLVEQSDAFEALVQANDDGSCDVALTRRDGSDDLHVLARARIAWPLGEARHIAFQNRDNVLRLEIEGAEPLVADYRENSFFPSDTAREGRSIGYRVWFGGDQGRFEFRGVRILRDLSYTDRGAFGVGAPCELGPDEYFLLGDHSSQSRDSRESGPVRAQEIVGRPVAVVWPPARWRVLHAVESGS